uniref:Uncharacterized protein n=1 Tax=Echeneis naucrates TaxID=173247 RepID=A0A665V206_ECHNA
MSPSPAPRDHTCDPGGLFWSQGGCLSRDQGQIAGTESGVMEMTEVEYTHLQHLIQAQLEAQAVSPAGPDVRAPPAAVMVKEATGSTMSPFTTTQAIDLSTSADEHCLAMAGEKTPAPYGEVPGFVLARIRCASTPTESPYSNRTSTEERSGSAARVCLEKRFNTVAAAVPKQSDIQSAVLSRVFSTLSPICVVRCGGQK